MLSTINLSRAFDFAYMETEKFYNSQIRDSIQKEYDVAMKAYEERAKNLGMMVRLADVKNLKKILRNKAFLFANCMDRGIHARSDAPKLSVQTYSIKCINDGLRIADQINRKAWSEWGPTVFESKASGCDVRANVLFDKTYDFLLDDPKSNLESVTDYYCYKQCMIDPLS